MLAPTSCTNACQVGEDPQQMVMHECKSYSWSAAVAGGKRVERLPPALLGPPPHSAYEGTASRLQELV